MVLIIWDGIPLPRIHFTLLKRRDVAFTLICVKPLGENCQGSLVD